MCLNKNASGFFAVIFFLVVLCSCPRQVFSDEPTSTPTMTDEERDKYLHDKYDNFKSGMAQAGEVESVVKTPGVHRAQSVFPDEPTPTPTWTEDEYREKAVPSGHHVDSVQDMFKKGTHRGNTESFVPEVKPNPPTNFKIKPGNGLAYLTWDQMSNAKGYVLYFSKDGKNFKRRIKRPFKKNEITIGVLQNGKTYYFGVVCVGPYGRETKMVVQPVVPEVGKIINEEVVKPQSCLLGREICA